MEYVELIVIAAMVLVNAVFAAYEIALASISVSRLETLVNAKRRGAVAARFMKDGIEKSLAVVQLGITLVGLIAGATGGAGATDDVAPYLRSMGLSGASVEVVAIGLVVVPLTAFTIVVGELMPKLFALRNQEWVCLTLSPMMRFFSVCAWPMVWFLENSASGLMNLSEKIWRPAVHGDSKSEEKELQELRTSANLARASRLIGARQEKIILGAARLAGRPVSEIILPAKHIRMLTQSDSLSDGLVAAHLDLHTRFPVCTDEGDPQSIVGYVTFKDIVAALKLNPKQATIAGITRDILSVKSEVPISATLELLLRERTHIALVRDQNKTILGMVTLEDIVEELVGDIEDEHDLLPVHVIRSGEGWIVGGGATLARIQELSQIQLSGEDRTQTLSGWVLQRLDSPPKGSEIAADGDLRVVVRKVRRQRVLEASIHRM